MFLKLNQEMNLPPLLLLEVLRFAVYHYVQHLEDYSLFYLVEKLYIVMELIEGAPLGEHFSSLKEKGESFSEERIWNIFIQV